MEALIVLTIAMSLFRTSSANAKDLIVSSVGELFRVEASAEKGFQYPFFLYIPRGKTQARNLLVIPNNTGSSISEYDAQTRASKRQALVEASIAERTNSILLLPVFPRPAAEPPIYTHALSRNAILVKDGPLKRVDLQLIKMIEAARSYLKKKYKIELKQKIFMSGFSASGSFVSRFAFLHPDLVGAVSCGSPGGWPIAPVREFKGKALPYPVGISDTKEVAGSEVDLKLLKAIPFYFFIGDKDGNDSVPFRDSFTAEDEKLIFDLFGKTPVERWPSAEQLYRTSGMNAVFKTYKGVSHEVTSDIREDVVAFFNTISNGH